MDDQTGPAAPAPVRTKGRAVRALELWLFRSRWLMAGFYAGLVLSLAILLYVFAIETWHEITTLADMTEARAVMMALTLIDLSLAANLVIIVIFSGYENFVSRIETDEHAERPDWMGSIDFSGLKMKLMASIVAISAVALLRAFMETAETEVMPSVRLAWLVGVHIAFVVSALLLAVTDFINSRTSKH